MKVLVLGASGATGKLVVAQLLERNLMAKIVVRESAVLPDSFKDNPLLEIVTGNVDTFSSAAYQELIADCDAVVCCLGHNISFKGLFGKPRKLVTHAVQRVTAKMQTADTPKKFILMSTTAYTHKQSGEKNSFGEALIFGLLKLLLPPHRDNMLSGDLLAKRWSEGGNFTWVAVRPDSLFDAAAPTAYTVSAHKTRSPMFNPGKTSRATVALFMCELLVDADLWATWERAFPVLYNTEE